MSGIFNPYFHLKTIRLIFIKIILCKNITQNNDADALESQITEAEIRYAIGKLKSDRSGAPAGLCIEMFKAVLDDIMPFLLVLFNNIFNIGFFSGKLV